MPTTNLEKEKTWKQRFADWKRSGLSAIKWCKAHDINYHSFQYWRTKLREHNEQLGTFIEISPKIECTENSGITLNRGPFQVQLERAFDETALERLLSILGRSV